MKERRRGRERGREGKDRQRETEIETKCLLMQLLYSCEPYEPWQLHTMTLSYQFQLYHSVRCVLGLKPSVYMSGPTVIAGNNCFDEALLKMPEGFRHLSESS